MAVKHAMPYNSYKMDVITNAKDSFPFLRTLFTPYLYKL